MIRTAFVDRDGVINAKAPDGAYIESWSQFRFLPGAVDALRSLREAGIRVVIVTNQRGIALGRMTTDDLDQIHSLMTAQLRVSGAECAAVFVCPHDEGVCDCRKPGLGLFRRARDRFPDIRFDTSIVVGDSVSDVIAGNRLGCRTYLITAAPEGSKDILAIDPSLRIEASAPSLLELVRGPLGLFEWTSV